MATFAKVDSVPTARASSTSTNFPKAEAIALALAHPDDVHNVWPEASDCPDQTPFRGGWTVSQCNSIVRVLQEHSGGVPIVAGLLSVDAKGEALPKDYRGVWLTLATGAAGARVALERATKKATKAKAEAERAKAKAEEAKAKAEEAKGEAKAKAGAEAAIAKAEAEALAQAEAEATKAKAEAEAIVVGFADAIHVGEVD